MGEERKGRELPPKRRHMFFIFHFIYLFIYLTGPLVLSVEGEGQEIQLALSRFNKVLNFFLALARVNVSFISG